MKSNVKISSAIFLAMCMTLVLSLFSGCQKDNNDDDDGDAREGYLGMYQVEETFKNEGGSISYDSYIITIDASTNKKQEVLISNFMGLGDYLVVTATVKGNSLTIPKQTIDADISAEIKGSGTKKGNSLNLSFSVTLKDGRRATVTCEAEKM